MESLPAIMLMCLVSVLAGCAQVSPDGQGCQSGEEWCGNREECVAQGECTQALTATEQAKVTAITYAEELPEYASLNGRGITVLDLASMPCSGCWQATVEFVMDSEKEPGKEDLATVTVMMENFSVVDAVVAIGGVTFLSQEQCEAQDGRVSGTGCSIESENEIGAVKGLGQCCQGRMAYEEAVQKAMASSCAEQGNLTGDGFYNTNTMTWWLDLDREKEGCAPACVVSKGQAEINWRCTGLIE